MKLDKRIRIIAIFVFTFLALQAAFGQNDKSHQKIVGEILTITEKYNRTWETLNMNDVAKFHSNSGFRYYRNMKLATAGNEEFKKMFPEYMKGAKSWKIKVSDPVVQVLSKDAAVISFTGTAELITTNNEITDAGTGAYTYVWQKMNNQWKLVHIHESAK